MGVPFWTRGAPYFYPKERKSPTPPSSLMRFRAGISMNSPKRIMSLTLYQMDIKNQGHSSAQLVAQADAGPHGSITEIVAFQRSAALHRRALALC